MVIGRKTCILIFSVTSDSQAALKPLQAAKTTSPLVQQSSRLWMTSLPDMLWGYFGSLGMLE